MCPEAGPVKIVTHTEETVPIHVYRLVLVAVGTTVTPHSRDGSTSSTSITWVTSVITGVVTGVFAGC